jgi:hypothetical protein
MTAPSLFNKAALAPCIGVQWAKATLLKAEYEVSL